MSASPSSLRGSASRELTHFCTPCAEHRVLVRRVHRLARQMTRQTLKLLPLCLVLLSGCGKEKQVPLTQQPPGDRSGPIGSADPLNGNGQRLEPGTKFARASAKLEAANGSKLGG